MPLTNVGAVWYNLTVDDINEKQISTDESAKESPVVAQKDEVAVNAEGSAPAAENVSRAEVSKSVKARKRRPIIKSISQRTTLNYILFASIMLALLWAIFFVALYVFYDTILKRDIEEVGHITSSAFPKRADDNSMKMFYKVRLPEIARGNSVAISVFARDENGINDIFISVDNMGNITEENGDVFDAVMESVSFDNAFKSNGTSVKARTDLGTYLCYCSKQEVKRSDDDIIVMYMILMKPYDVINPQTNKIIYIFIICTLIVLVLTCIFSYFASRYQTKHLTDFSQKAKRIAYGDYAVQFSGDGYDEYESLADALNAAKEKICQTDKMQRDIIANVSHDIRTPLTMIRAYAEMLRDMPMDDKKRNKTANIIISEAERLTALTTDVLNYSRIHSGVAEYKFESCDIAQIAKSTLMQFDIFRERDGMKFLTDIDKKAVASCDRQTIEQVFYNLIINAFNYCGDDKTVVVRVKNANDRVRVEVTDHGRGIEQSELENVWDRYYRAAHAKRAAVGSGLGLSICKDILIAHGAEYGVVSEIGKGTTFWFELKSTKSK